MNNKSIYASIIPAKNGTEIPVFSDGRTVDSKYNPERDADNIISSKLSQYSKPQEVTLFFIVIGIGSGTLIEKLYEKFPKSKIVAVEICKEDLIFLERLPKIKKLSKVENIILTDINNIENILINNYLPAIYPDLRIIEQRGWVEENKNIIEILNKRINKAIGIISADFSVQAHFGKIWQSNIINNLKTLSHGENKSFYKADNEKTAAIIAAGPTLDYSISSILKNREKYYIIATDTAYSSLIKHNIVPEVLISIDGQHISHNHFFNSIKYKNTLFLLDLCSDYSIGKFLQEHNCNTSYFITGHPLSLLANNLSEKKFPELFSGAGTVTITAIDFALKQGFKNIELFGADFAYLNGKPYTKGTYFDSIFGTDAFRINTSEQKFDKIMFRTELIKTSETEKTTEILSAYKMSLEQYLAANNCFFKKEDNIYKIKSLTSDNLKIKTQYLKLFSYNFDNFIETVKKADLEELKYPLLPYVAWLRNNRKNESLEFIALLKLAQSNIVGYN